MKKPRLPIFGLTFVDIALQGCARDSFEVRILTEYIGIMQDSDV